MAINDEHLEKVGSESKSDEIAVQSKLQGQNPDLRKSSGSYSTVKGKEYPKFFFKTT